MATLKVNIENKKSEKAVRAVLDALGLTYQVEETTVENPSPSGDKWFLDQENLAIVDKGVADIQAGRTTPYTDELRKDLFRP